MFFNARLLLLLRSADALSTPAASLHPLLPNRRSQTPGFSIDGPLRGVLGEVAGTFREDASIIGALLRVRGRMHRRRRTTQQHLRVQASLRGTNNQHFVVSETGADEKFLLSLPSSALYLLVLKRHVRSGLRRHKKFAREGEGLRTSLCQKD